MNRKNGSGSPDSEISVKIFTKKKRSKDVDDFATKMGAYANRIRISDDPPDYYTQSLVLPHAVMSNTRLSQDKIIDMKRPFSETTSILENWLVNTKNISVSQLLEFLSDLNKPGDVSTCSLHVPCIVFYGTYLDFSARCEHIFDVQKSLNYRLYICNKEEKSDTNLSESDLVDNNEFQLMIVDALIKDGENIHISYGSIGEIHEYVRNRTLIPHIELKADKFTKPELVSGLLSVDVLWSKTYNKTVLILGERHDQIGVCDNNSEQVSVNAHDFFFDLLDRNERSVIDVFGEFSISFKGSIEKRRKDTRLMHPVDRKEANNFLSRTSQSLAKKNCFYANDAEYQSCPYKNRVRFHLTDFRDTKIQTLMYYMIMFEILVREREAKQTGGRTAANLLSADIRMLQKYKNPKHKKQKSTLLVEVGHLFEILKINKQIENIRPEELKNRILENVGNYFHELEDLSVHEITNTTLEFLENLKNAGESKEFIKIRDDLIAHLHTVGLVSVKLMDFYLLSRMLRNFEKPGQLAEPIQHVIVYAGVAHTKAYVKTLKGLGFEPKFHAGDDSQPPNACLRVSKLTWPYVPM